MGTAYVAVRQSGKAVSQVMRFYGVQRSREKHAIWKTTRWCRLNTEASLRKQCTVVRERVG